MTDRPWAEVRGLGRSFGLNRNEPLSNYLTEEHLIHHFVTLVANGGGLTLNVGPAADGQIPLLQQERLLQLGEWLKVNGEAIYETKAYDKVHTKEKATSIQRIDSNIDFRWVRNSPDPRIRVDNFQAKWEGYITPNFSETYTFLANADDGIRVWVDGNLLIDQWNTQNEGVESFVEGAETSISTKSEIKLEKGRRYAIKVEYFEDKLNAIASLSWSSKSQKEEVIPASAFYQTAEVNSANGLKATYSSMKDYMAYTVKGNNIYAILLEWPDDECTLDIDSVDDSARVSLLGREGYLPWKLENDKMIVDMSSIKFSEIPCKAAWTLEIER